MSYLNDYDDAAIDTLDKNELGGGFGGSSYPALNVIIGYFRMSAAVTALLAIVGAFAIDKGILGIVVTLVAGMSAAGIQLALSELISVFVDTAKSSRSSALELKQLAADMSTVRQRVEEVASAST